MNARIKQHVRVFAATAVIALSAGVLPAFAAAADPNTPDKGFAGALNTSLGQAAPDSLKTAQGRELPQIVAGIISSLIGLLGVVLFLYLLYGGFMWMTAGGEEKKVKEAIQVIRNAVVGLVIIALSYAIANFVISKLGAAVQGQ